MIKHGVNGPSRLNTVFPIKMIAKLEWIQSNAQRKSFFHYFLCSEDEDEVLLIPTTPKSKQDNNSNKISLVSPSKQANISVKRITPKRKSSDVGRKKSTPSGDVKSSFRVTKFRKEIKSRSPKKGTSPKFSLSATSPRTRSVSNTPVHAREKVSPKKIPEVKYDVKSKLKSPGKSYKKSTAVLFDAENDMTTQKNISHITDSFIDDLDEVLQSRVTDKQLPSDVKKSSQTKVQVRSPIKEIQDHNNVSKSIDVNEDDNFNRNGKQGISSSLGALSVTSSRTRSITSTSAYSAEKVSHRKVPSLKSDCKSKLVSPVTDYRTKTKSSSLVFGAEYSTKARKHISRVSKYDIDSLQSRLTDKQSPTDDKRSVKSPKLTTISQAKSPAKEVQNYKNVKKSIDYGKDNSFHKNEKQIINQIDSETTLKDSIAATIPLRSEFNVTASSEKGEGTLSPKHRSSRQMPDKEKKNKVSDTEVVAKDSMSFKHRSSRQMPDEEKKNKVSETEVVAKDSMSLATTSVSETSMPEEKLTQSLKGIHKYEPEQVNGSSVADRSKALEQDKGEPNGKLKATNLNPTENTLETKMVLEQMDGESKKKTISKCNTALTEENSFPLDYTSTERVIIKKAFEQVIDSELAKKQQKLKAREHDNNHLNALSNIGERTSECKSSSDDFEKCILNAISHGDLIYKKASDDAETDRVLRSRNSLGLQYSVETDDQICQQISGSIDNNDASPLELEKATDSLINKGTFKQSLKHEKSTDGLTLVKPETSIKPGNETKETCDFDLPSDLLDEVLFSPTLAERVKARTRCSPANSYNVSPARSRSNSLSSNQSDSSTTRVKNNLATKSILNRAKTQLLQEKNCVKNFRCKKKCTRRDTSNEVQLRKQQGEDSPNCQPRTHKLTKEEIETVDDGIKLVKSDNNQKIRKYLGDTVRHRKGSFDSQELKYNGINKSDFKKSNQSAQATTVQVCEEYSLKNRNIGKISPQCSETSSMQSSEAVFVENFAKVNHQKGSDSPVFTASPVAKRRKSKSRNIKTATDQVINDKVEQMEQKVVKTNQSLSISMDTNFLSGSKDRVKRNSVSGKERSSKNKTKSKGAVIRISQSIRDSLLENTSPARDKIQGSDKVDECSSESVSNQSKGDDSNLSTVSKQTTPNCKKVVPSSCYGSGYSSTPRDDRCKAWARKNKAEESLRSNNCKRRKLEKLKFIIPDNTTTSENSSSKTLDQLKDMSPIKSAKINASKKTCAQKEISQNKKKDIGGSSQLEVKENKLNSNESFSLKWEYLPDSKNTVKLKESWSLLSNRSVSKLLSSEDGAESFDGFTEEDINTTVSVASDLSYEEHWEVDKSINSEREFDVDIVEEKADEKNIGKNCSNSSFKEEFEQFLPIFSSPNKKSDSSWVDACEGYIDKSIKSTENIVYRGWTSPRKKVYNKDTEVEKFYMSPSKSPQSPRINKRVKRPISNSVFDREKVDEEIDFNFRSPQKDRSQFSPLKVKNGKVVDTSSPHCKTSTPRQLRYNKDL